MTHEQAAQVLEELAEGTQEDDEAVEALNIAIAVLRAIHAGFRLL